MATPRPDRARRRFGTTARQAGYQHHVAAMGGGIRYRQETQHLAQRGSPVSIAGAVQAGRGNGEPVDPRIRLEIGCRRRAGFELFRRRRRGRDGRHRDGRPGEQFRQVRQREHRGLFDAPGMRQAVPGAWIGRLWGEADAGETGDQRDTPRHARRRRGVAPCDQASFRRDNLGRRRVGQQRQGIAGAHHERSHAAGLKEAPHRQAKRARNARGAAGFDQSLIPGEQLIERTPVLDRHGQVEQCLDIGRRAREGSASGPSGGFQPVMNLPRHRHVCPPGHQAHDQRDVGARRQSRPRGRRLAQQEFGKRHDLT